MILPIVAYGHPVLREPTVEVKPDQPGLQTLIANMWETMYQKGIGLGLAAPQVNQSLRLLVLDTQQVMERMTEEEKVESGWQDDPGLKAAILNPTILSMTGGEGVEEEGCLSLPKIRVDVARPLEIRLSFQDEQFNTYEKTFVGLTARALQHEIDHLEAKLIVDYLSPLKRKLMQRKLQDIVKGKVSAEYRMLFGS
ncbi:MAG: hypothetical protein RIQ34_29 [Bacteroidota bacterium]